MNFFEHQRLARRNSRIMVLLFAAAVIAVVVAVDLVLGALYAWSAGEAAPAAVYVAGAAATVALVLCVSLFNVARLAEGGVAVARMIGARRVPLGTTDPLERRLCNVVEEMAIASGVRVPEVYVMDGERGINAFAAGWDTSSAVVAVTRGTLQTLTRDELQGVVAHEFSHILNGDMRLNVRMLGVLAGIVFIGSVGEFVMRSARGSSRPQCRASASSSLMLPACSSPVTPMASPARSTRSASPAPARSSPTATPKRCRTCSLAPRSRCGSQGCSIRTRRSTSAFAACIRSSSAASTARSVSPRCRWRASVSPP
jgi:Zn-dependent protease with chaperone function